MTVSWRLFLFLIAALWLGGCSSPPQEQKETGPELLAEFRGHRHPVSCARFHPSGKWIASGDADPFAGRPAQVLDDPGAIVRLWEVEKTNEVALEGPSSRIHNLAFSPDGNWLACGGRDRIPRLWRVQDPKSGKIGLPGPALAGHDKPADQKKNEQTLVLDVAFSPDSRLLVTSGTDKTARIWEVASGKLIRTLSGFKEDVVCARYSRDGEVLVTHSAKLSKDASKGLQKGEIAFWDVKNDYKKIRSEESPDTFLGTVLFARYGEQLIVDKATRTATGQIQTSEIQFWDLTNLDDPKKKLPVTSWKKGPTSPIVEFTLSSNAKVLITIHRDWTARFWDLKANKELFRIDELETFLSSVALSPDGKILALGGSTMGRKGIIRLYKVPEAIRRKL